MNAIVVPPAEDIREAPGIEHTRTILNTLFKWKWLIVVCLVAVMIPVAITTMLKTREYEASIKILLNNLRAQITLSATGGMEEVVNTRPITSQNIKTEIQILTSPDLLRAAAAQSGYPLDSGRPQLSEAQKERAFAGIQKRLSIHPVPDTSVFEVKFSDPDPHLATRFLNALVSLYLEKQAVIRGGMAAQFFEEQTVQYGEKFERATENLKQYQEDNQIYDIGDELEDAVKRSTYLEQQAAQLQTGIRSTQQQIAVLEAAIQQEEDEVQIQQAMVTNPEVTALTSRLLQLEQEREELLQRYTSKSRFVTGKESEIAALRAQLQGKQRLVKGDTIFAQNRTKTALKQQLLEKKAELASLQGKREGLLEETAPTQERLTLLKESSFIHGQLRKEFDLARTTYLLYRRKSEEARIAQAMDKEQFANVRIIQEASPPVFPGPRGLMRALILAAITGLVAGIGGAFGLEFFNPTVKNEDDIERFLGIPTLAIIPQLDHI